MKKFGKLIHPEVNECIKHIKMDLHEVVRSVDTLRFASIFGFMFMLEKKWRSSFLLSHDKFTTNNTQTYSITFDCVCISLLFFYLKNGRSFCYFFVCVFNHSSHIFCTHLILYKNCKYKYKNNSYAYCLII